jgi:signal transduction histidine kinase
LFGLRVTAQPAPSVRLTAEEPYQKIGKLVQWFVDTTGRLSLAQVQQAGIQQHFSTGRQEIGAYGLSNGAIWAHGSFSSAVPGSVYLLAEFANIDSITLYYYDGQELKTVTSGSRLRQQHKVWNFPGFNFALPSLGDRQQEFWLRVRSGNAVIIPLALATEKGIPKAMCGMYVVELVYLGIVIALFFYNLSLFRWIRDKRYFYYLGYLFFLAAFVLLYLRGFHVILGGPLSRFVNMYGISFVGASYLFAIPFSISFVRGKEYAPKLVTILSLFNVVALASIGFNLAGWRQISILLGEVISVSVPVLFVLMAVKAYRQHYRPALFFLLAWALLLAAIVLFAIINMGWLPLKSWYFHILPVGSAFEVILLSLALGYRYALLKQETAKLSEAKTQYIEEQNQLLEKKVGERTIALRESNKVKDKLLGIISHDLRTPLNNLSGLLELSEQKALSAGEVQHFSQTVRQNIKYLTNTIQNLLNWSLTQMERIETRPKQVNLSPLAYQVMDTFRFAADQKAILLRKSVPEDVSVFADFHQLELVLRNLVDNAIKFTPQGGIITIGCRPRADEVEVYVSDTGKGMEAEEAAQLLKHGGLYSTEGTDDERGTGLGLQLCKEFVANNGGELRVKSEPGTGTEFYFTLPRFV